MNIRDLKSLPKSKRLNSKSPNFRAGMSARINKVSLKHGTVEYHVGGQKFIDNFSTFEKLYDIESALIR